MRVAASAPSRSRFRGSFLVGGPVVGAVVVQLSSVCCDLYSTGILSRNPRERPASGRQRIIRNSVLAHRPGRDGPRQVWLNSMVTPVSVFINGVAGVFTGIAVLYVMMKVLAFVAGRPATGSAPSAPRTD